MNFLGLVVLSLAIYNCVLDVKSDDQVADSMPTMFWRFDEQCKPGYRAYHITGDDDCKEFECDTRTFNFSYTVPTENGTICDDNKVCMGGKCVKLNTTYFPLSKKADIVFENGESCSAYLDEADNFRFAEEYCNDKYNKYNCPVTCKKYSALTCRDKSPNICPRYYYQGCNGGFIPELNNIAVKDLCPFSCGVCKTQPLRCSNSTFICLNGGTCQNTTNTAGLFGFKCSCPKGYTGELCELPNPCDYSNCGTGFSCVQVATYNYMCVPASSTASVQSAKKH